MQRNKYTLARRGIWFVMRTMLSITLIVALGIGVLLTAMNVSNLYILATEGMQLRAEKVLQGASTQDLKEYFTASFLSSDKKINEDLYSDYTITNFDYRLTVKSVSVWPWSSTAKMQVVERLASVSGSINANAIPTSDPQAADKDEEKTYPIPEWTSGRYDIIFKKVNGRWYISSLKLIEENPKEAVKATPNYSLLPSTPTPLVSATPAVSVTPGASPAQ